MPDDLPAKAQTKQPWPFPLQILREEWPEVTKAKFSFFLCAVVFLIIGGWIVYFLFNSFIIPGKEATIQALHAKSETLPGISSGWPSVIWRGPTNTLYVTNEYGFYQASSNCAITNIFNPSTTGMSSASLTVLNASSNVIFFYMTDASVRNIGEGTTNALRIKPGKLGVMSFECVGQTISLYANVPQP